MADYLEEIPPHKFFTIKNANEWMTEAKMLPPQKKLIGTLFFENETSILFGETNSGKSIAAVQFADCISRGTAFGPLENTAGPQVVVYFDFELTQRQFSICYTDETGCEYVWSNNFNRVEIDPDADYPEGDYCQYICDEIEQVMLKAGAKVGIIDNITFLNDELEKSKGALPLMKQLKIIKRRHDFSVLILAHTQTQRITTSHQERPARFYDDNELRGQRIRNRKLQAGPKCTLQKAGKSSQLCH